MKPISTEKLLEYKLCASTIIDLKDSLAQAEKAYNEGHFRTAVARSTNGLEDLIQIKNKLLYIRMKAYQEQREMEKAYIDAENLEMITKFDTRRPIHMARLLMKKENLLDAVKTCDSILKNDIASMHQETLEYKEGCDELEKIKKEATHRLEHRMDLIKVLPHEIVTLILDQLSLGDILNCMHVARHWQDFITYCPTTSLHKVVLYGIKEIQGNLSSYQTYKYLGQLSSHVKNLTSINAMYGKEYPLYDRVLDNVSFYHLRSLNIGTPLGRDRLVMILKNSSRSLEEIQLTASSTTINEVLDNCPNLKSLSFGCTWMNWYWDPKYRQRQQTYPSLTRLQMYTRSFQNDDIKRVLKFAVNLQEFTIKDDELTSFDSVYHYGKKLHHICIDSTTGRSNSSDRDNDDLPIDATRYQYSIDTQDCFTTTAQSLLSMLDNMEYKAEALSLSIDPDNTLEKWEPLVNVTLPYLRYIKVSFTQDTEQIFTNIIRQCPTLEEVILFRLHSPPNTILDAVTSLPMLQSFAIENGYFEAYDYETSITTINDNAIRQLFLHHVELGNASTLQHVRLRYIANIEPETFEALVKIKHLKSIHLTGLDLTSSENSMGTIILGMGKSFIPPELETLVLEALYLITDEDTLHLDCPIIKLIGLDQLTLTGIRAMVEGSQKLKKLFIQECECVDDNELADLAREENIQLCT
ncbi:hypothetical protein BDA99DRAFT_560017 [Phascolomyces articulosus]|uniref:F-box domain-containing protein n=1 Tax=Phascolomyces articulosus TaxID=60185 RepID=A0AAD5PDV1_9FUNG|nr:hypothetical protein BDA99DRAFT_560017 [Phascolomyces articulosus]